MPFDFSTFNASNLPPKSSVNTWWDNVFTPANEQVDVAKVQAAADLAAANAAFNAAAALVANANAKAAAVLAATGVPQVVKDWISADLALRQATETYLQENKNAQGSVNGTGLAINALLQADAETITPWTIGAIYRPDPAEP